MMEEEIKMLNAVGMLERIHSLTRKCTSCVCSFSKTGRYTVYKSHKECVGETGTVIIEKYIGGTAM